MRHEVELGQIQISHGTTNRSDEQFRGVGNTVGQLRAETMAGKIERYEIVLVRFSQIRGHGSEAVRVV